MRKVWRAAFVAVMVLVAGACSSNDPSWSAPDTQPAQLPAPANYVDFGQRGEGTVGSTRKPMPRSAFLEGPGWRTEFDRVAVVHELPSNVTRELEAFTKTRGYDPPDPAPALVAASGYEFVLTFVDVQHETDGQYPPPDDFQLVVGDRTTIIDLNPKDRGIGMIAVSVPIGADAVLQHTDAGRVTRRSLRTGVVPGGQSCRAPKRGGDEVVFGFGDGRLTGSAVQVYAEQVPFVDGRGFARKGRCWLTIDVDTTYVMGDGNRYAEPPDGYRGVEGAISALTIDGERHPAGQSAYDVPESIKTARVTVRPRNPTKAGTALTWTIANTPQKCGPAELTLDFLAF